MKREIKFRVYNTNTGNMLCPSLKEWGEWVELPQMRIMQYTGLKDKNGKEIYEGDIVRLVSLKNQVQDIELIGDIVFDVWGCYAVANIKAIKWDKFSTGVEPPEYLYCLNWGGNEREIIGNIYENPEFMEASGWSKLYHDVVGVLPDKWKNKNTQTVYTDGCFIATNPKYAPMKYSDGEWRDIKVAHSQVEVEAEKTLRFLKTGRQHD